MPSYQGLLDPEETAALLEFIRSLREVEPVDAGAAADRAHHLPGRARCRPLSPITCTRARASARGC